MPAVPEVCARSEVCCARSLIWGSAFKSLAPEMMLSLSCKRASPARTRLLCLRDYRLIFLHFGCMLLTFMIALPYELLYAVDDPQQAQKNSALTLPQLGFQDSFVSALSRESRGCRSLAWHSPFPPSLPPEKETTQQSESAYFSET